jgi:chromate transporter
VSPPPEVPFREAARVWTRIALQSFGGPAGQIAVMHRILVEEKRWIGEERFLHALSYCMLLPGPEAQQLATYIGWLLHGTRGGLVAGGLFVLPGFVSILALSWLYAAHGHTALVAGIFFGIKPAVLALVLEALLRIARRALGGAEHVAIAAAGFVAIFAFGVPFPWIVLGAGLAGFATARHAQGSSHERVEPEPASASFGRALRVSAVCLSLWLVPIAVLFATRGGGDVFTQIAVLFSKLAVVTFGGAYAVLTYLAQQAVEVYGWLSPREMLDGLGMAETTPGPLIQVVQFVGFMGAWRSPGALPPWLAGTLAAVLTTWVTYVPCFLWIFLGAPYVERLRANRWLRGALSGITAAVVGVIANLAIWFSLHTLFATVRERRLGAVTLQVPEWASVDLTAAAIAVYALVAAFAFHMRLGWLLASCAALGLAWRLLGA